MFIDEPEGNLDNLPEYLGSASAIGSAVSFWLKDGSELKAFFDYSQEFFPERIKLFNRDEAGISEYFQISASCVQRFKIHRHGIMQSTLDDQGVPIAGPAIIIRSKKIGGEGKIICPGTVAIQADEIEDGFEILDKE